MSGTDLLPVSEVKRAIVSVNSFGVEGFITETIAIRYDNGYGLSVIRGHGTYSGDNLFEAAVIHWDGDEVEMVGDPLGWQSEEELLFLEKSVANMPTVRKALT